MLDQYCAYHLEDLGVYSPEKLIEFKGQCTQFVEEIKAMDHDLYVEIMEMSKPKQLSYMKAIYESNNASNDSSDQSINIEDLQSESDDLLLELEAFARLSNDDPSIITEDTAGSFLNRLIDHIRDWITKIGKMWDNLNDTAKYLSIGGVVLLFSNFIQAILGLGTSFLYAFLSNPGVFLVTMMIALIAFIPFGPNQISGAGLILTKIKKVMTNNAPVTKGMKAINIVLSTDMRNCISSNVGPATSGTVKDHIVYNLIFRDRADEMTTPASVAADKALACILSYITNAIAEMYSSLLECLKHTSGATPVHPYNITSLDATLATMDLSPECQSINDALHDYIDLFEDVLSATFNKDAKSMRFWHDALRKQINKVLGGTHATPIKNATRGVPKSYSNKVIVFDKAGSIIKSGSKKAYHGVKNKLKRDFPMPASV